MGFERNINIEYVTKYAYEKSYCTGIKIIEINTILQA